jgi:hypothetical protein
MAKDTDKPANQVNLTKVELEFKGEKYDLIPDMLKMQLDESIENNSMSMNITFLDASNLTNKIDFDGTETITVEFNTLGDREVSAKYRLFKNDIIPDDTGNMKGVVLYGVSEEHFKSAILDVNQSYREQISGFAQNVFDKLGSNKKLELHETSGRGVTIIPGMTVFESMDFLASRSYDTKYRSSAFRFYETFDGFHYVNIERKIAEGKKDAITYVKVQDARTQTPKWNHIASLKLDVAKDSMHKIKSGMYASEAKEIDLINHKVITSDFTLAEKFDEFEHLDSDAMTLESKDFIEDSLKNINTSFWLFSGQTGETDAEALNFVDIIPRRLYYLSALEQVKASMQIPGNSSLSPGMVINLDMLEITSKTKSKEQEGKVSGNYFVTSVKHLITRDEYICLVNTCKDSYRSNIPNPEKNIVSKRT